MNQLKHDNGAAAAFAVGLIFCVGAFILGGWIPLSLLAMLLAALAVLW